MIDDMYLRYVQFRTPHRRFYTNVLHKIGNKDSEQCNLCQNSAELNEHKIIGCDVSDDLWNSIERWIREIGVDEYEISNTKIF